MAPRSNTRSRSSFRGYRGGNSFRGPRGRGRGGSSAARSDAIPKQDDDGTRLAERFEQIELYDDIDDKLGFSRTQEGPKKEGWLVNMHPVECRFSIQRLWRVALFPEARRLCVLGSVIRDTTFIICSCDTVSADRPSLKTIVKDSDWPGGRAAVDYYFIQEDGGMFKCTMNYEPYFYISCVVRPP
jgi:DNA polymerase epsilon subunit 1